LGPSTDALRDALLTTAEGKWERYDVELEDQPDPSRNVPGTPDAEIAAVFARPASTTVYGVGDSTQRPD
jgi:hypothetical protein